MTKKHTIIVAFIAFVAGCLGGPAVESLVVRPLSAQQAAAGVQRWEVQCVGISAGSPTGYAERANDVGGSMGAEGWDLVAIHGGAMCFKRPR